MQKLFTDFKNCVNLHPICTSSVEAQPELSIMGHLVSKTQIDTIHLFYSSIY